MKDLGKEEIVLPDARPDSHSFRVDVLKGMFGTEKKIPSKYLYDREGSLLFERICTLEEYYIPVVEIAIMQKNIEEIARHVDCRRLHLVEYGCGDCVKTRLLMNHLFGLASYVPIDISLEQLQRAACDLEAEYPDIPVLPVCADYTREFRLPISRKDGGRKVVYFPGSTIGNFDPHDAVAFLEGIGGVCGEGGALLVGVDLKKDPFVMHGAYNDGEGVTAAFNLNLLKRIRRELGWDLRVEDFEHYAFYNPHRGRVEMHLVSLREQDIITGDGIVHFDTGESIWTESSYKYTLGEFARMAAAAGFGVCKYWTDERRWFAVYLLVNEGTRPQ